MVKAGEHPKAPHNQPFNINGNKSKKNSWSKHPPYNNNKGQKDART